MSSIKEIPSKETYIVRQPLLRKGKSIVNYIFKENDLFTTHHFEHFVYKNLTGIISLFKKTNTIFAEKKSGTESMYGNFRKLP